MEKEKSAKHRSGTNQNIEKKLERKQYWHLIQKLISNNFIGGGG